MKPGTAAEPEGETFERFYGGEFEWARRLAYVLTSDAEAAEDIAQDAFLSLHPRFASLDKPRAYLRVTIVNAGRKHHRRDTRRRELDNAARPMDLVSEDAQEVLDIVDELPSRQRAVVVLRYFEGLSEAEIASILSCRPGTVKSLASRALTRLRKELT